MEPIALITGASSGIGRAVARWLAARGHNLLLVARRTERLEALAAELRAPGRTVAVRPCDVTDAAAVRALAADVGAWAHAEVLVNAAGHGRGWGPPEPARVEQWPGVVEVNLVGAMNMVGAFLPGMRERDAGHIVNVGSIFALGTVAEGAAYSASKHGLRAFTLALRQALAGSRVRLSLVHPGSVSTEFGSVAAGREPRDVPVEKWPYRPLLAEDVAEAIGWVLERPPPVEITELVIRPTAERQFG
jgi:NADP-dependent 3-hydroxy acid dehydrogenase YdfG